MTTFSEGLDHIEPRLLRLDSGGWMAVSEPGAPLALGVTGKTADSARERFAAALRAWIALLDEPVIER